MKIDSLEDLTPGKVVTCRGAVVGIVTHIRTDEIPYELNINPGVLSNQEVQVSIQFTKDVPEEFLREMPKEAVQRRIVI